MDYSTKPVPQEFDVFAKRDKKGWRFDCTVPALNSDRAKQEALVQTGITNPHRLSVYPRR